MRRLSILAACLSMVCATAVAAERPVVYFEATSFAHAEPLAVTEFIDEWGGPFHGGDAALTINRAELGVRYGSWRLSYIARYDYFIDSHPDTAEAYYLSENKLPFDAGRRYRAKINVNHIRAQGLKVSRRLMLRSDLSATLSVSYLAGRRLTQGKLSGHVTALSDKDFDFDVNVDYVYSKDHLFDREVDPPSGNGYSIDLDLHWQPADRFAVSLTANDLVSRIVWRDAPFTEAVATSDTKRFDDDGFVTVIPTLSGVESNEDHVQVLWPVYRLSAVYRMMRNVRVVGEYLDTRVKKIPRLGAAISGRWGETSALWGTTTQALTLRYRHGFLAASLTADKPDVTEARTLGLSVSLDLRW